MNNLIKIATKSELSPGKGKICDASGTEIALFNVGGQFHAIDNMCPHRGGSLGEGELRQTQVECPWHGWIFDVSTGESVTHPDVCQKKYDVKIENNDIFIQLTTEN